MPGSPATYLLDPGSGAHPEFPKFHISAGAGCTGTQVEGLRVIYRVERSVQAIGLQLLGGSKGYKVTGSRGGV